MNIAFNESKPPLKYKDLVSEDRIEQENEVEKVIRQFENMKLGTMISNNPLEPEEIEVKIPKEIFTIKSHPIDNVLGDLSKGV